MTNEREWKKVDEITPEMMGGEVRGRGWSEEQTEKITAVGEKAFLSIDSHDSESRWVRKGNWLVRLPAPPKKLPSERIEEIRKILIPPDYNRFAPNYDSLYREEAIIKYLDEAEKKDA